MTLLRAAILLTSAAFLTYPAEACIASEAPRRATSLSDSSFFRGLASWDEVTFYPRLRVRRGTCSEVFTADSSLLGCLGKSFKVPAKTATALIQLLSRCAWVRARPGSPVATMVDLGLRFGEGPSAIDLIIDLDPIEDSPADAKAVLWARGQGGITTSLPAERSSDLRNIAKGLVRATMHLALQRSDSAHSSKDSLAYSDPDCACAPQGEFVYYEDPPVPVHAPKPHRGGAPPGTGKVVLHVSVGREGKVCAIKVIRPVEGLTQAAVAAVAKWEYRPAMSNGKPVCVWVEVPVNF